MNTKVEQTKNEIKCRCGANNKITCPRCSELKMVMMLKNGNNHLKYKMPSGKLVNPVWYNHLSKNRKSANVLLNAMFRRFLQSKFANVTNKLMFYDNKTKQLISTIEL